MTISDIAKLAGVSVATVSRVLNHKGKVSANVEKKVLQIVKENNYVPNIKGRSLRTSHTMMLLVMIPNISNSFYSKIVSGLEYSASKYGYNIIVAPTRNNPATESKYFQMLTSQQVDGIISFSTCLSSEDINLLASKYPFVIACECPPDINLSTVSIDNYRAAYEAVSALIEKGHKKIGMLTGTQYHASALLREKGYQKALQNYHIPYDEALMVSCQYNYESGILGTERLLALPEPPTAIFCVCDDMAAGAIRCLHKKGLTAGKDIDIIGFDNTTLAEVYTPSISSVSQPCFDIGTTAVDLLMEKVRDITKKKKKVILPHDLIVRETFLTDRADSDSKREKIQ